MVCKNTKKSVVCKKVELFILTVVAEMRRRLKSPLVSPSMSFSIDECGSFCFEYVTTKTTQDYELNFKAFRGFGEQKEDFLALLLYSSRISRICAFVLVNMISIKVRSSVPKPWKRKMANLKIRSKKLCLHKHHLKP